MRLFRDTPESVLAIYAHPDDADVAAGGSLARWARDGATVDLIIVCDGAKGSHDPAVNVDTSSVPDSSLVDTKISVVNMLVFSGS